MSWEVRVGDCRTLMAEMEDCSVDSIVCDPPYGLSSEPDMMEVIRHWMAGDDYTHTGAGFMGKSWDSFVPGPSVWREAMRVLKPGGHLLAFFGSRTYDIGTLAIRMAGFEVRDQIMWVYSTGFPKSHNLDNLRGKALCDCAGDTVPYTHEVPQSETKCGVRPVCDSNVSTALDNSQGGGKVLQQGMAEQGSPSQAWQQFSATEIRSKQPCVEGRSDAPETEGKLCKRSICAVSGAPISNGEEGRIRDGASPSDGGMDKAPIDSHGMRSSCGSQSVEQPTDKSATVSLQSQSQNGRAWPVCDRCGKPNPPRGLGTALKPAHEPICVARKPLIGTVAANVLAHGTGAINVDGCRVATDGEVITTGPGTSGGVYGGGSGLRTEAQSFISHSLGRFPANIIHDGSDEVVSMFPDSNGQ